MSKKILWAGKTIYKEIGVIDLKLREKVGSFELQISNTCYKDGITNINGVMKTIAKHSDYIATDSQITEEWLDLLLDPKLDGVVVLRWNGKEWNEITLEKFLDLF
ncbi:MAG: hypothetical protein E7311_04020 [Clostridiales bacterium]|nr:hypothetical protein [Clostridiales bacterium]